MNIFRFEHPEYLYGLIIVPIAWILLWWMIFQQKKNWSKFGELSLVNQLIPDISYGLKRLKISLLMVALSSLILAIANPQIGSKIEKVQRKGIDMIIAVDISNSMLAEDLKPNRLTRAKREISKMVDQLSGDRIGIIVFAGKAYTQLPITTDYSAAKMFLSTVNTDFISSQGTSIAAAIEMARNTFKNESDKDKSIQRNKAIVIITDGEDHEEGAMEEAQRAAKDHIKIFTIGMGTLNGAPIPDYRNGTKIGYKKDQDGHTVISKFNESLLQNIAKETDGTYSRASNSQSHLKHILDEINKLDKSNIETQTFKDYESRFQIFAAITILLLFIETLLSEKKRKWLKFNIFEAKSKKLEKIKTQISKPLSLLIGIVLFSFFNTYAQDNQRKAVQYTRQGNEAYKQKDFQTAEEKYQLALLESTDYFKASYNLANNLYKQKKYKEAAESYQSLLNKENNPSVKSSLYHNLGNSQLMQKEYEKSIEAYKQALKLNPKDQNSRYNLAYAMKMLDQQNKDQQNKDQQNKDQQNKDQQNKDQQNKDQQNKDQQNKDQQNKDQQNKDQKNQDQQKQAAKMDKKEAELLLKAMAEKEKDTKEKVDKRKVQVSKTSVQKDW